MEKNDGATLVSSNYDSSAYVIVYRMPLPTLLGIGNFFLAAPSGNF